LKASCGLLFPVASWILFFHLITGERLFCILNGYRPKTSPVSPIGKLLAGVSIGLITIAIRNFGAYPEEMFFAILVVNGFTPFINAKTKPKSN